MRHSVYKPVWIQNLFLKRNHFQSNEDEFLCIQHYLRYVSDVFQEQRLSLWILSLDCSFSSADRICSFRSKSKCDAIQDITQVIHVELYLTIFNMNMKLFSWLDPTRIFQHFHLPQSQRLSICLWTKLNGTPLDLGT